MTTTSATALSRRSFLGLGALTAFASGAALVGCAPQPSTTLAETSIAEEPKNTNWVGEAPQIDDADIVNTLETDVLIVGAGNGGMACAASCVDLGLDFILCEKNAAVEAARGFFGVVNSDCTKAAGVDIDPLKLLNEMSRYADFKNDPRVTKVWIDESAEMKQWLDGIAAKKGLKARTTAMAAPITTFPPFLMCMWPMNPSSRAFLLKKQGASICPWTGLATYGLRNISMRRDIK